ncbi:MAG: hypothetical protein MUO63_13795 [Desulfobulbaceae bacterium]|nr:hypothetical protein [Desulfobulbaceae bacterium]
MNLHIPWPDRGYGRKTAGNDYQPWRVDDGGLSADHPQNRLLPGAKSRSSSPTARTSSSCRRPDRQRPVEYATRPQISYPGNIEGPEWGLRQLYSILQILSTTIFEKIPIFQLLTERNCKAEPVPVCNQLKLIE